LVETSDVSALSISIRFFDQQFDLHSIRFQFFNDLHTSADPTRFVWPHGNGSAVVLATNEAIPPTAAVVDGLNREDVEWAKYRSISVAL